MMDIKYTNDGKKVLVVGKLNNQETIVQEIFVSGEQEIPSGENFVVKSLHDAPAVSWKEKQLKILEERYDRDYKVWDAKINDMNFRLRQQYDKQKLKLKSLVEFEKNAVPEQLQTLFDFLNGEIRYVFIESTFEPLISSVDDNKMFMMNTFDGKYPEDLKLISVFGRSGGDLSYRINNYSDGSGSWTTIHPAKTYDEALEKAQFCLDKLCDAALEKDTLPYGLGRWRKIQGIVIPDKVVEKEERVKEDQRTKKIEELKKQLAELEEAYV